MDQNGKLFTKWWIRLLLAMAISLVVSEYGSSTPISKRLHTADFYKEYGATFIIAWLIIEWVHRFHNWLEARYNWRSGLWQRLGLQLTLTFFAPALLVYILASLYFYAYQMSIHDTDYLYFAYPFILVLIVVLNVAYIMIPTFIQALKQNEMESLAKTSSSFQKDVLTMDLPLNVMPEEKSSLQNYSDVILVYKGSETVKLFVSQISAVYILEGTILVHTFQNADYVIPQTLDELERLLDPKDFFRINRKLIAHFDACKSFMDGGYGKLEVKIEPAPPVAAMVSQLKAKAFREWISRR